MQEPAPLALPTMSGSPTSAGSYGSRYAVTKVHFIQVNMTWRAPPAYMQGLTNPLTRRTAVLVIHSSVVWEGGKRKAPTYPNQIVFVHCLLGGPPAHRA